MPPSPEYLLLMGFFALSFGGLAVLVVRRRRRDAAALATAPKREEDKGLLLDDGTAACVACRRATATEAWPRIVHSKLDRDPFGHRELHNQPPMYVVEDDDDRPNMLCVPCKRLTRMRLEEKLSDIRARMAHINTEIERELACLQSGELLAWAHLQSTGAVAIQQALEQEETTKLLPEATIDEATVTLPPGERRPNGSPP